MHYVTHCLAHFAIKEHEPVMSFQGSHSPAQFYVNSVLQIAHHQSQPRPGHLIIPTLEATPYPHQPWLNVTVDRLADQFAGFLFQYERYVVFV